MSRRVEPLLWGLAVAFAFFGLVTVLTRPPGATALLGVLDGGGALLLAAGALYVRRKPVPSTMANGVVSAALLFTVVASLVALKALHHPAQTTNVLLVQLTASILLLSLRWTVGVLAVGVAGWSLVAWSEGFGELWIAAGLGLVATTIMAITIQTVRLRDARRQDDLLSQLAEKARRLETSNRSLEAFAYVIAHDLKEPIRATRYHLDDALEHASNGDREPLQRAAASHDRLSRLVQGLLEWSRATTTPVERAVVDVSALLRDETTRSQFESALTERGAKLEVDDGLPLVLGTPALVRQVLGNLILNAVKHNPAAAPLVRVRPMDGAPRGLVAISVEDNGPGFPARVLQGATARRSLASGGFGLEVAHRAVERLGGALQLMNRPDGGAEVRVLLPPAPAKS